MKNLNQIRDALAKDLAAIGLDGNVNFDKPQSGYSQAVSTLSRYGIELNEIPDSHAFMHKQQGGLAVGLAWSNPADPFSPISMPNMLVVHWYQKDNGAYEVVAYVS